MPDDLESRWRDWRSGDDPSSPDPARATAPPASAGRLRPVGGRLAVAVFCVLALLALGTVLWTRSGAERPPQAALPGADGPRPNGSESAPLDPARDLTSLASATASGFAGATTDDTGALVSFLASNVLDGNPATAWRTDGPGDGETLTLEFPREITVTQVGLAVGEPGSATGDAAATRRGRSVEQVTWSAAGRSLEQVLDPDLLDTQSRPWPTPVATRTLTLRLDRSSPGPVGTDGFVAVSQVVVIGRR
jgi:hypothetical protein